MKCPNCGNMAPEGSLFCNQCGTPLKQEVQCPSCGEMIPANSVFCPKCGKMVRNDMAEEHTERPRVAAVPVVGRENQPQQPQPQRLANDAWQQPAREPEPPVVNNDEEDEDDDPRSNFNRNLLLGILAAVILIGALMLMRNCNGNNDRLNPETNDTTAVATSEADTGLDPMSIFMAELNRSNLMGDGATAGAAVKFPGDGGETPDRIAGVTYQSNSTNRSFFKVYLLTRSGSIWNIEPLHTQYLNGRTITMDNSSLIADINQVPRAVKVNGKDCIYFAYMNAPDGGGGEGSNGRVSLSLYDINNKKLMTLDYDGPVKSKDGRLYVYGKPLQSTNSPEMKFLQQEATSIKKIYFPTEEELKAEQEAKEKAEEEKALSGPENAGAKWKHDNGESLTSLKGGEEVKMKAASYDKPIFNLKDMHKKIESESYIVFSDKKGAVYGFNKNSRKYFVIYTPSAGESSPSEIGFGDDNRVLRMRTADGHISYDLVSDKAKLID